MRIALLACAVLLASPAFAHEVRPAYLELTEAAADRVDVVWKVPTIAGGVPLPGEDAPHPRATPDRDDPGDTQTMPCGCPAPSPSDMVFGALPIHPAFPHAWRNRTPPRLEQLPGAAVRRWTVDVGAHGLDHALVGVHGLETAMVDVLVRVARADGRVVTYLLRPDAPSVTIEAGAGVAVLGYLRLGVEHILFGVDHLLFVLGLILLVGDARRLVKTITAFTVAHSITLGLATLGVVRVPPAPVEAVIALSIVFLACELVRQRRGEVGETSRRPWLVAFVFGLLHGFGFAGALSQVGLPPNEIPVALFLFNVGVEVGQLAFVGTVLGIIGVVRRTWVPARWRLEAVPAYAIGSVAAFWLIQRLTGMWTNG